VSTGTGGIEVAQDEHNVLIPRLILVVVTVIEVEML
jgi:hypothetical protein